MTRTRWFIALGLLALVVTVGRVAISASAAETYGIDWYAVAGGGGISTSVEQVVAGTAGQAAAGGLSGGDFRLGGGYWGDTGAIASAGFRVFLPLALRN